MFISSSRKVFRETAVKKTSSMGVKKALNNLEHDPKKLFQSAEHSAQIQIIESRKKFIFADFFYNSLNSSGHNTKIILNI